MKKLIYILWLLIIVSCNNQEPEIIIHDNSKLYFEFNSDTDKFNYDFIINSDTISYNESVLGCTVSNRAEVNRGDNIRIYFQTEQACNKEVNIYINSKLWKVNKIENNKHLGLNYIIE